MGREKNSNYYDSIYSNSKEYQENYRDSPYWVHWTQVIKFLGKDKNQRILEIGCGTGQLAEYLLEEGYINYFGFDFSQQAVELAKRRVPEFTFIVNDALSKGVYKNVYDTVICLEVLEHINHDLNVILNIEKDKTFIFSVPNFGGPSHVRWFISERQIKSRYYKLLDIKNIIRVGNIYICKSVRSDFKPNLFQRIVKSRESFNSKSFSSRFNYFTNKIKTYFNN